MRTVTLQLNFRATTDVNWSIRTEIIVDDDDQAEVAGEEAARFLMNFQKGVGVGLAPDE